MSITKKPKVIVIGAGPAGLTAALELVRSGRAIPIVLEASNEIGGISRTVNYKGYRMDIGGHRFFSKSDWVMEWWRQILPVHSGMAPKGQEDITCQKQLRSVEAEPCVGGNDKVMLIRNRLSRIYFLRKYFDYPIKLNANTLRNLGPVRLVRIGVSYVLSMLFPRRKEESLEDFFVNRFGGELYRTFFRDYTEKVWGVQCRKISAEWGAQRIKGLSILAAIRHAIKKRFLSDSMEGQKTTETSLIERFMYPKLGPGQLWEEAARQVVAGGGEIRFGHRIEGLLRAGTSMAGVRAVDDAGHSVEISGDYIISTMPVKDLILGMVPSAPVDVARVARELPYRDFITVGLLLKGMKPNVQAQSASSTNMPPDNWIYIQERDVRLGRLQIFNNWSPYLVDDSKKVWLGLEYFCQEGDDLWRLSDGDMLRFAVSELAKIGMIEETDLLDGTVIRVPKAYPAYFGAYAEFNRIREFVDGIDNLFLIGRNGMHRYNNQDHSMLTAKLAAEAILNGTIDKRAIWGVNIDDEYHEEEPVRNFVCEA